MNKNYEAEFVITQLMAATCSDLSTYEYLFSLSFDEARRLRRAMNCNALEVFLFFNYIVYRQRRMSRVDGPLNVDWEFVRQLVKG